MMVKLCIMINDNTYADRASLLYTLERRRDDDDNDDNDGSSKHFLYILIYDTSF